MARVAPLCPPSMRPHASLSALLLLTLLTVACATTPPLNQAAAEAADDLATTLVDVGRASAASARAADGEATGAGAETAKADEVVPVIVAVDSGIYATVVERLHGAGFVAVARGELQGQLLRAVADQLLDAYSSKASASASVLSNMNQLGQQVKSDVLIIADVRALEGDVDGVVLLAWQLSTGFLLATGDGDSLGWADATVTVFKWVLTPFVVLYDIGRRSAEYAFDSDEEDPTFLGTLYDGLVFVVYLPFAVFTSDYEATSDWVSSNDPAEPGAGQS